MKVLVAILSNEAARYAEFWACMMRLEMPAGSVKDVAIGTDYVSNQNIMAQRCLDEGFDFLWLMGDDHSFSGDLLERLLVSAQAFDLPILVPLCSARRAPFALVDYGRNPDPGPDYLPISLADVPAEGIVELDAAGSAGMLIHRDVLEAVPQPWFVNSDRSEDIVFCEKAVAAGFKIHADVACRLGHILTAVVTPGHDGDGWVTGLVMGGLPLAIGTAEDLAVESSAEKEVSAATPPPPPDSAERIEIWVDEDLYWWWRAVGHDGTILRKDSGVSEAVVIGAANAAYPDVMVFLIASERYDSRDLRPYSAPTRLPG